MDLATRRSARTREEVEADLSADMDILATYFHYWRLRLSEAKTVCSTFHLCNKEAKQELVVHVQGRCINRPQPIWESRWTVY